MGLPHMACTCDGLVNLAQRMATRRDHLIDTVDIIW